MARIEELRREFAEVAEFVYIYIKEAHPEDEWQMDSNAEDEVVYNQPTTMDERLEVANACYAAWPERLYVIEQGGTIAFKGGIGPYFFDPDEVREFLEDRFAGP